MQKRQIPLVILGLIALFSFGDGPDRLVGRWENKGMANGRPYTFLVVFHQNGEADGFLNGKAFITTRYFVHGDTVGLSDPTCGTNYVGLYKSDFFAPDSLKFHLISDSCTGRVQGTAEFAFVRVKKTGR